MAVGPRRRLRPSSRPRDTGLFRADRHAWSGECAYPPPDDSDAWPGRRLRLDVWLMGYIMPAERVFVNPQYVYLGTKLAAAELIRGGVTVLRTCYYFEAEVARAAAEAGLRGICGKNRAEIPVPDAETYEDSLAYAEGFMQEWKDHRLIVRQWLLMHPIPAPMRYWPRVRRWRKVRCSPADPRSQRHTRRLTTVGPSFTCRPVPRIKKLGVLGTTNVWRSLCAR